jgi:hypothetical protein
LTGLIRRVSALAAQGDLGPQQTQLLEATGAGGELRDSIAGALRHLVQ